MEYLTKRPLAATAVLIHPIAVVQALVTVGLALLLQSEWGLLDILLIFLMFLAILASCHTIVRISPTRIEIAQRFWVTYRRKVIPNDRLFTQVKSKFGNKISFSDHLQTKSYDNFHCFFPGAICMWLNDQILRLARHAPSRPSPTPAAFPFVDKTIRFMRVRLRFALPVIGTPIARAAAVLQHFLRIRLDFPQIVFDFSTIDASSQTIEALIPVADLDPLLIRLADLAILLEKSQSASTAACN